MKIYGRTFGEIYRMLPWTFRGVIVISAGFFVFIFLYFGWLIARTPVREGAVPLEITGLGWEDSVYDPALARDPRTGEAWLAFANIQDFDPVTHRTAPGIRLARAMRKDCRVWGLGEKVFSPGEASILAPDGVTTLMGGNWRYETPALVFDAGDPGREWKLFAYKYFWNEDRNLQAARRYGMIAMKSAPGPEGPWSEEEWPLAAAPDYPPPPYQEMVGTLLSTLDPSLKDIVMYTRPSVFAADGVLYMTLSAFTAAGEAPDRVVMLASRDHGRGWEYLGTPLRASDAALAGPYTALDGATLLLQGGRLYLAAVFGDGKVRGDGTFIFGFEDIAAARLRRDGKTGAPLLLRHIPRQSAQPHPVGGGHAAYTDACPLGMLTGEFSGRRGKFQIFKTYISPDGKKN